jgi:hypothetical protein
MPITLNHSNIGVQYSTGSNYIIETVKSDLYLSNEIVDTIVRDNLQAAPVIPIVSIQDGSNIYAVESYTYTGSANTADYTRVFPKNTTCDILIVGGGGGGGFAGSNARGGGGGGAGQFLLKLNYLLNAGTYNIKIGNGGLGGSITTENGETGKNTSISTSTNTILLESFGGGGGARGKAGTLSNGLNGASGGGGCGDDLTNRCVGGTALTQFVNNNTVYTGYNGANGGPVFNGGGGGGYTSAGYISTNTNGGDGGSGITNDITGIVNYYCAGGGGGGYNNGVSVGTRGGNGGNISAGNGGNYPGSNGTNATNGSGSGGGGAGVSVPGGSAYNGGNGGSGIVIIRYLLGTIPTNNFLTSEPTVISQVFTESIQSFVHSGGTEAQTSHTITVGQNTICDILMIGGGGGGGQDRAGGGGAGALILSIGNILSAGTYTIRVGNKGLGAASAGALSQNGFDCEIVNSSGTVIYRAKGGGGGGNGGGSAGIDGGNGGGAGSQAGGGGNAVSTNIVGGITTGPIVTTTYGVYGKDGGRNITAYNGGNLDALDGAGGGGIGEGGSDTGSLVPVDSQFVANNGGKGGDGLYFATINGIVYNFKNYFNVDGIQDGTTGNFFIGGGGGGGDLNGGVAGIGGKGGGGAGGESSVNGVSATGFGSGGGGAGGRQSNESVKLGGNGSAGIVVIKFKSIVGAGILDGITHKRLNFAYNSDNLVAWYKFNGDYLDSSGNGHNLTNVGTVIQSTHIIEGQAVEFDSTDYLEFPASINPYTIWNGKGISFSCWVRITAHETWARLFEFQTAVSTSTGIVVSVKANPNAINAAIYVAIGSTTFSYSNWNNPLITNLNVWRHLVFCIGISGNWDIYIDNVRINGTETANIPNITYNFRFINKSAYAGDGTWDGQMDDFRIYDRALSAADVSSLYNKTYSIPPNTYTLNFPVPTIADINNNSNIVLRGTYDISLSTMNSSIIPKSNQYIPKPTTFASDLLSIRYNLLNPVLDPSGAQLTYNTSNTNVYHMGNVGIGTKNPEYSLDVRGSVNAKSYYLNGRQINEPISELGLSEGMIAQVRHLTYTQMEIKNNTGWDAINDNLTTGFVIAITPKSNLSKILVNIIVHIGLAASNSSVWWGIKLYRKIGSGDWTEVTGPNGTETGSAAATAGTPVWISYTMYAGDLDYQYKVTNVTGTYLDSPNTTSTVYYTAYWNNRLGDNPSAINTIYLNRAESHGDAYRPAPSSSWTASEIWYG